RKGIAEVNTPTIPLTQSALLKIEKEGFKYVQVKGLTTDKHYDYIDPHFLVLVPMKELPVDQDKKDIYEPISSELLLQWANEKQDYLEVVIAHKLAS
ncbi:MAG TPA: hypothetical protein VFQ73_12055, partial [Flavisolibacter sp.]|nr:hypothetical protein [Flavisolibacter sp.]